MLSPSTVSKAYVHDLLYGQDNDTQTQTHTQTHTHTHTQILIFLHAAAVIFELDQDHRELTY